MKTSEQGIEFICGWEKLERAPYDDGYGYLSIGYGHRIMQEEQFPAMIDEALARKILAKDIAWAEDAVNDLVNEELTQQQFDAVVSFVFNCGRKAFETSTLRTLLNAGLFDRAADQFGRWIRSAGKVSTGLKKRRARERDLFLRGIYDSTH